MTPLLLTGEIPPELGRLSNLKWLWLCVSTHVECPFSHLVPLDELPGPLDDLPDRAALIAGLGVGGAVGQAVAVQMLGLRRSMAETEKWRRLAEVKLWQLTGYPVSLLRDADLKERQGVEWESGYDFQPKRSYRNLELPSNPFDFVRRSPLSDPLGRPRA